MRVAIIGGGGREHALAWACSQSPKVNEVLCFPGNAGSARTAGVVNLDPGANLVEAVHKAQPDLVIVGPEQPLVEGVADTLRALGVAVVGPSAAAAHLEGSKAFAKEVMARAGVPTARCEVVTDLSGAEAALALFEEPPVVKADGLAAGKGVTVAESREEALTAVRDAFGGRFGEAGEVVLLEERLIGQEISYIVLTDGERFRPLPTSQDHKRLLDGDEGPNTGGMGAYTPNPLVDPTLRETIHEQVIRPTLRVLREMGTPLQGFLYAGLMLTEDGPRVLEFNVRSGDPETQALLFGLQTDLVPTLVQVAAGRIQDETPLPALPTASVVMASEGYPGKSLTGRVIEGLDVVEALEDVFVFHAGTQLSGTGAAAAVVTSGGRVLAVTARGQTVPDAVSRAYAAAEHIRFTGAQIRRDIGWQAVSGRSSTGPE